MWLPGRDLMLVAAFAVILITVVVQGSTLGWLIRQVQPVDGDPPPALSLAEAEAAVARVRRREIEAHAYAPDGTLLHPQLLEEARWRERGTERYAADSDRFMRDIRSHFDLVLAGLAAGRAELVRLHRAGEIEDEVLHDLERDLDLEELGAWFQRGE